MILGSLKAGTGKVMVGTFGLKMPQATQLVAVVTLDTEDGEVRTRAWCKLRTARRVLHRSWMVV